MVYHVVMWNFKEEVEEATAEEEKDTELSVLLEIKELLKKD